jgi:putative membrane protein
MNEVLTGTDRIVNTPLPIAYSITISQIVWVYIIILPFMIMTKLKYLTIPAVLLAAYVLLGLLVIGTELENPFGDGVNDLPLENFCDQIQHDVDVIVSKPAPTANDFTTRGDNALFFPLYEGGYNDWYQYNKEELAQVLRQRMTVRGMNQSSASEMDSNAKV